MSGTDISPPSREPIDRRTKDVFTPMALRVGLELGLFTRLSEGSMSANELAGALGCAKKWLEHLLYALAFGKFLEVEGGNFTNVSVAGYYLVRGKPTNAGGVWQNWTTFWNALLSTA